MLAGASAFTPVTSTPCLAPKYSASCVCSGITDTPKPLLRVRRPGQAALEPEGHSRLQAWHLRRLSQGRKVEHLRNAAGGDKLGRDRQRSAAAQRARRWPSPRAPAVFLRPDAGTDGHCAPPRRRTRRRHRLTGSRHVRRASRACTVAINDSVLDSARLGCVGVELCDLDTNG